jgi:hypothetical protein
MSGRIEKNSKVLARLYVGLAGTQCDDLSFALIEVFDLEIDVRLLGAVGARPHRRLMIGRQLKCQCRPRFVSQSHPVAIVAFHLPARDCGVEGGQGLGVGAIESEQSEAGDGRHRPTVGRPAAPRFADKIATGAGSLL